jgi:hypothetical protein
MEKLILTKKLDKLPGLKVLSSSALEFFLKVLVFDFSRPKLFKVLCEPLKGNVAREVANRQAFGISCISRDTDFENCL